jgi:hypothetical protein
VDPARRGALIARPARATVCSGKSPIVPAEVCVSRRDAEGWRVSTDVAWCPTCRADCTVEVIALAGDPGPVALCVDCNLGVEIWWLPELLTTTHEVDGAGGGVRAS